jgi:L-lysine 2,3-aminomutase
MSETAHFAKNWQQQLADAFSTIEDLCHYLNLNPDDLPVSPTAAQNFPLRVQLSFAACM